MTNITSSPIGIYYDIVNHNSGSTFSVTQAGGTIGTYVTSAASVRALINYGITLSTNSANGDVAKVYIQTSNEGSSDWSTIDNTCLTIEAPSKTPTYYSSSASCIVELSTGDKVRCIVSTTNEKIDINGGSNGDTFLTIIDIKGGERGPTGSPGSPGSPGSDALNLWEGHGSTQIKPSNSKSLYLNSGIIEMPQYSTDTNILSIKMGYNIITAPELLGEDKGESLSKLAVFIGSDIGVKWDDSANNKAMGMQHCICIGNGAGKYNMEHGAIAIGSGAGAGSYSTYTGRGMGIGAIGIGHMAAYKGSDNGSIIMGRYTCLDDKCGQLCTVIGQEAGRKGLGNYNIALGYRAAFYGDAQYGNISIGYSTNMYKGIGNHAHYGNVAMGIGAAQLGMDGRAIAIGSYSGYQGVGFGSIVIGDNVGGLYSKSKIIGTQNIWIGYQAAYPTRKVRNKTIVLDAVKGVNLDDETTGNPAFFVKPIRDENPNPPKTLENNYTLKYNPKTGEITYNSTPAPR